MKFKFIQGSCICLSENFSVRYYIWSHDALCGHYCSRFPWVVVRIACVNFEEVLQVGIPFIRISFFFKGTHELLFSFF